MAYSLADCFEQFLFDSLAFLNFSSKLTRSSFLMYSIVTSADKPGAEERLELLRLSVLNRQKKSEDLFFALFYNIILSVYLCNVLHVIDLLSFGS